MNVKRRVDTPDHDFASHKKHYFHVSCYKIFEFKPKHFYGNENHQSTSPLQIYLRSAYHEKLQPEHHAEDLVKIFQSKLYQNWTRL